MPLTFPVHLFNPTSIKAGLRGRVITSPPSISGVGQTINTDGGGFWVVEYNGIALNTADKVRAWRAWESMLDGGSTVVNAPVPDTYFAPRPLHGKKLARPSGFLNGSDDPYFPEAVGFAAPLIVATCGSGLQRATQLSITVTQGSRLKGGERFSINHATAGQRMYQVGQVLSQSGQTSIVSIRSPLREAVGNATQVDFDWPSFEAVMIPESDISPDIQLGRFAEVSIAFREAI